MIYVTAQAAALLRAIPGEHPGVTAARRILAEGAPLVLAPRPTVAAYPAVEWLLAEQERAAKALRTAAAAPPTVSSSSRTSKARTTALSRSQRPPLVKPPRAPKPPFEGQCEGANSRGMRCRLLAIRDGRCDFHG